MNRNIHDISAGPESHILKKRTLLTPLGKWNMVSAVSGSSQLSQLFSTGATSSSARMASLEKEIAAKEAEAKETQDAVESATIAAELASLRAELAKLQREEKKSETTGSGNLNTALQQAELINESVAKKGGRAV